MSMGVPWATSGVMTCPAPTPTSWLPRHGIALGRLEALEDLGGDAGRPPGVLVRGRSAADEVAGEEDELGVEAG